MVYALPAKKTELETVDEKVQLHTNLAEKWKVKSDNAYKKFSNSCIGSCFYAGKMKYYDVLHDKHEKAASLARLKRQDLLGVPRKMPTPIVEEDHESTSPHKTQTSKKETAQASSSSPLLSSSLSIRDKSPVHTSSRH